MKRSKENNGKAGKAIYLTLGKKSHPVQDDDETVGKAVQRVIEDLEKKQKQKTGKSRNERAGYYIFKEVPATTKISNLRSQFNGGYHIYAPISTTISLLESDDDQDHEESTSSKKRRRKGGGEVFKINQMIVGNGNVSDGNQFSYGGIKHALDKVFNINQVFGNGIALNNGESIMMNDWIDKKISSDDLVSRESLLEEFESKIQEMEPCEQQKYRDIFSDVLYYQSSKDNAFILEEYVIIMCYFYFQFIQ